MKNKLNFYIVSSVIVAFIGFIIYYIISSYTNPEQLADQTIQARDRLNQNLIFLSQNPQTLNLSYQHKINSGVQKCFTQTCACEEGKYYPFIFVSESGQPFSSHPEINPNEGAYDILGEACRKAPCALKIKTEIACLKFCLDVKKSELKVRYTISVSDEWKNELKEYVVQDIDTMILLPTLESFEKKIPKRKNLNSKSGQNVNQIGGYGD